MNFQFSNFQKGGFKVVLIIVVAVVIIAILALVYFFSQDYFASPVEVPEVGGEETNTTTDIIFASGDVGEVMELNQSTGKQEPLVNINLPEIITSTIGSVIEIKETSIVVKGSGSNFADNTPRNLTCIFTDATYTFLSNTEYYQGKTGLGYIKVGDKVSLGGDENIRGKTEFILKTISILQ